MKTARDLLISAIDDQVPIVLILGQGAWIESEMEDPILVNALEKLGRSTKVQHGWSDLLGTTPTPPSFYEWLAERFARRVHPPWLSVLGELPWSAVFTSAVDSTLKSLLTRHGHEPEVVLTASETPRAIRSTARPPLYYLFGCAGSPDPQARPPADRSELNGRRIGHALPIFNRVLDTATTLGLVVVDGFVPGRDWLKIDDMLGAIARSVPEQILWFGGQPQLGVEDADEFNAAVASRRVVVEQTRLGTVVSELRTVGRLPNFIPSESHESGIVSFQGGRCLETTPEERLRVEAVASIVDDTWTAFLPPLGPDAEYDTFRRFHGDLGGPRLLVEGVRRSFGIERDFEQHLMRRVTEALADHANLDTPIIVHGQSGTGKSVALAHIVAQVRERKMAAVLYSINRIPQPQEIAIFCEEAEKAGAETTLIVCDANRDIEPYRDLLLSMRSRGRRVVILGSRYRIIDSATQQDRFSIEAPSELSTNEQEKLSNLLAHFFTDLFELETTTDTHILAFLYRYLPLSRSSIASGLGTEARVVEHKLRMRSRQIRKPLPETQLAQKLIEAGFSYVTRPLSDEQQNDTLEPSDAANRIIDLVMVAGSLNCPVPINLLLRAAIEDLPATDIIVIAKMFREQDLFRWKWADEERSELFVLPRLTLEAELLCRYRLGSPEKEAERLIELIGAVRSTEINAYHERIFLFNLLQQIGNDGPRGPRYKTVFVLIAHTLTKLRKHFGVIHPNLMLQEASFRRAAVRENVVNDEDRLTLLEEARDAVQAALDGIANGTIEATRRTRQHLHVERASLYGFLAYDRAKHLTSPVEIWSSYIAAKTTIRQAMGVTDNYYPFDVALWTPIDMIKIANLTEVQEAEIKADIYSVLDQVDPNILSPKQREKFNTRRIMAGEILQDRKLTQDAYAALEASSSTAGYFLRARELAPVLRHDIDEIEIKDPEDLSRACRAAEFLTAHLERIEHDERCLSLLLECRWIAVMGRRPFRGQRQPLPVDQTTRRTLLPIVHALNRACGGAARHVTEYLEAVLAWVIGDEKGAAIQIFRELGKATEYQDPGRVVRRHVITDISREPHSFSGRVERRRSEGHWVVRVDDLNRTVDLLSRDFPHEDIAYGRSLRGFAIAFNYIGPIADPIGRRR